MNGEEFPLAELLVQEHRRLDDLLGRFLSIADHGSAPAARDAMSAFDQELRRHTAVEEDHLFGIVRGEKLLPRPGEGERERLFRDLTLEHVQIRELSGMIVRILTEKADLASARHLLPNLLSRWDAHTAREEREFPGLEKNLDPESAELARRAINDSGGLPPRRS